MTKYRDDMMKLIIGQPVGLKNLCSTSAQKVLHYTLVFQFIAFFLATVKSHRCVRGREALIEYSL